MLLDLIHKYIKNKSNRLKQESWKAEIEKAKFERDFPTLKRAMEEKKTTNNN